MEWKPVVFALAICLLYIPMVFMAVNTFFPKEPYNDCYNKYPYPAPAEGKAENRTLVEEYSRKMMECERAWLEEKTRYDGWKFIVVMVINILAALLMLLNLDKSIIFGLFFGVVITAFSATWRYMDSRSVVGFILLLVLFGIIIYFVNSRREILKDNKARKK